MSGKESSVTDQPIGRVDDDAIGIVDYATAMSDFIQSCATPLTVGIQGEWGSGKTSLMSLIREEISRRNIVSVWLNTWEYAMFREPSEIVPSVMRGLLEGLRQDWPEEYEWPNKTHERMQRVSGVLKTIGKLATEAAVQKSIGLSGAGALVEGTEQATTVTEISEVRRELSSLIDELITTSKNPYEKVVFFIDDLDRVEPPMAVGILESLKNIFDIRHCVFLLAIDYDIVVKGLESKFGEKTDANEREFRSFFDKIIQVPVSMPVGAYDIDRFIERLFNMLGFEMDEEQVPSFRECVGSTVGGIPRSIKRYVNTYSLLRRMRNLQNSDGDLTFDMKDDLVLFFLIGVQIAYPRIYQMLLRDPDYPDWDREFAEQAGVEIVVPDQYKDNELLDELWEQIVWSACQRDAYLKARALSVLSGMNMLRRVVGDDDLAVRVGRSMLVTNITSVDDDQESNHKKYERVRLDSMEQFIGVQKERAYNDNGLTILKAMDEFIMGASEDAEISRNIAPGQVSYAVQGVRRKRVFVTLTPTKTAGPRIVFTDTSERVPVDTLDAFDQSMKERIAASRMKTAER